MSVSDPTALLEVLKGVEGRVDIGPLLQALYHADHLLGGSAVAGGPAGGQHHCSQAAGHRTAVDDSNIPVAEFAGANLSGFQGGRHPAGQVYAHHGVSAIFKALVKCRLECPRSWGSCARHVVAGGHPGVKFVRPKLDPVDEFLLAEADTQRDDRDAKCRSFFVGEIAGTVGDYSDTHIASPVCLERSRADRNHQTARTAMAPTNRRMPTPERRVVLTSIRVDSSWSNRASSGERTVT